MIDPLADPRTEDTLVYDLLSSRGGGEPEVVGRATFRDGRSTVAGPEGIRVAVEELLGRGFVDRLRADERPRGYRRTGEGTVGMLLPGMAEHFIARMRGLWLSYPDGSVVTARPAPESSLPAATVPDSTDAGPPVTDSVIRRTTLQQTDEAINVRPLVLAHPPETGIRPTASDPSRPLSRSDCGWLV